MILGAAEFDNWMSDSTAIGFRFSCAECVLVQGDSIGDNASWQPVPELTNHCILSFSTFSFLSDLRCNTFYFIIFFSRSIYICFLSHHLFQTGLFGDRRHQTLQNLLSDDSRWRQYDAPQRSVGSGPVQPSLKLSISCLCLAVSALSFVTVVPYSSPFY